MIPPFDPENLTPSASLNRMPLLPLPGVELEPEAVGKPAYPVLSLAALAQEIRRRAQTLRIGVEELDDAQLPPMLDRCFESASPDVRASAEEIARLFGRRLGHLVLTLHRGDPAVRAARPDWNDSYWTHWASISRIWVGGGLAAGRLGLHIVRYAQDYMVTAGGVACSLMVAEYPSLLPLVGAARSVPEGYAAALVFDFGSTSIKRAIAAYENGSLTALQLLPPVPTHVLTGESSAPDTLRLATEIGTLLAQTWREHDGIKHNLAPVLVCGMASYIAGNHPLPRQGGLYAALHAVTDNLGQWLSTEVSARLNRPIEVILLHDGTAAARTYAGARLAAVITMGTALGVGFPPETAKLRTVDPRFAVYPVAGDATTQT